MWVTVTEVLVLSLVLLTAPGMIVRLVVGLPIVVHLGWTALTSVPLGAVPGPPTGAGERRRNYQLRYRVVAFLNEVQRVEKYVQEAQAIGLSREEMEKNLRVAEKRIRATAAEVVDMTGRIGV